MILVDTSVLVEYFKGIDSRPSALSEAFMVNGVPYGLQHGKESYEKAALLNFQCRRAGVTVRSTIDLLIAETAVENNLLLHNDGDFDNMSRIIEDLKIHGV